jgi:crossover junction endodeoxyribonuclease RusA
MPTPSKTTKTKKPAVKKPAVKKVAAKPKIKASGHTITITGRPTPKGRPRLGRRGRVFTPERTLIAEAEIREAWNGPKYEVPVSMNVVFNKDETVVTVVPMMDTIPSKLRGDIDNYIKTLMDGLNGAAWVDDKQVHYIVAVKE